jgi:hypothetical protein
VTENLRGHYGIDPGQEAAFGELLTEFDRGAREIMNRSLQAGERIADLSPQARARLQREYLRWQLASEAKILRMLDDGQLANLRGKMPTVFTFEPTGSTSISIEDGEGF